MGADHPLVERLLRQLDELEERVEAQQAQIQAADVSNSGKAPAIAGVVLGLAVGILTGLAQSPAVGAVAAAAVGLGGSWIGLHAKPGSHRAALSLVAAFAVAVAIAAPAGLWGRSHGWLAANPKGLKAKYVEAGFDDAHARRLALMELGFQYSATAPEQPSKAGPSSGGELSGGDDPVSATTTPYKKQPSPADGNLMGDSDGTVCDDVTNKLLRPEVTLSSIVLRLEGARPGWQKELEALRAALETEVDRHCDGD
ncbi:MAG: hypothetical protein OEZ06_20040 [Myxococcales bacterium]|nr:hypothetical protein [Myxococcales bacterium]